MSARTTSRGRLMERIVAEAPPGVQGRLSAAAQPVTIRRTYAGPAQRATGAWSWALYDANGRPLDIGSQYPVTELLRGEITFWRDHEWDWNLDPLRALLSEGGEGR